MSEQEVKIGPNPGFRELFPEAQQMNISEEWSHSVDVLTWLLSGSELSSDQKILALCERGLSYRMIQQPERMYPRAETDFTEARQLAQETENWQGETLALVGLIDLLRTGDRDPKYRKNLEAAETYKASLLALLTQHPNEWCVAAIKGYQQLGLLTVEYAHWSEAVSFYVQALSDCNVMLETNPKDSQLLDLKARSLLIMAQPYDKQGQDETAASCLEQAMVIYEQLGDIRGMGNAAMSLGMRYQKRGELDNARTVFTQALNTAKDKDPEIYNDAVNALRDLPSSS